MAVGMLEWPSVACAISEVRHIQQIKELNTPANRAVSDAASPTTRGRALVTKYLQKSTNILAYYCTYTFTLLQCLYMFNYSMTRKSLKLSRTYLGSEINSSSLRRMWVWYAQTLTLEPWQGLLLCPCLIHRAAPGVPKWCASHYAKRKEYLKKISMFAKCTEYFVFKGLCQHTMHTYPEWSTFGRPAVMCGFDKVWRIWKNKYISAICCMNVFDFEGQLSSEVMEFDKASIHRCSVECSSQHLN